MAIGAMGIIIMDTASAGARDHAVYGEMERKAAGTKSIKRDLKFTEKGNHCNISEGKILSRTGIIWKLNSGQIHRNL